MKKQKIKTQYQILLENAEKGDAKAQFEIGEAYIFGMEGIEINFVTAFSWFKKSADQKYPSAMFRMGTCYQDGVGIDKDEVEACYWYSEAAKYGDADSMYMLVLFYLSDDMGGFYEEYEDEALHWLRLARNQGHKEATKWINEIEKVEKEKARKLKNIRKSYKTKTSSGESIEIKQPKDYSRNRTHSPFLYKLEFTINRVPHCNIELISSISKSIEDKKITYTEHKAIFSKTALRVPINLAEAVKSHVSNIPIFLQSIERKKGKKNEYIFKNKKDQCRQIKKEINLAMKELLDTDVDFLLQPDRNKQEYKINSEVFEVTLS
jgi:hypothetical protein